MDDCHTYQLISADGTKLHARHWTAPTTHATLALVHGFGEHGARYAPMAAHLTAQGVQVIAIDLRGHGRSDGKRGVVLSYDDFRADLAALLDRARQLHAGVKGPLVLFGHSMGGGIVLDHGLSASPGVDGIIASAPLVALADPVPAPVALLAKIISKIAPRAAMKQPIDGTKISTLAEEQRKYVEDPLTHGQLGFKTALEMIATGEALTQNASRWALPLIVYHSDQDQLTDFATSRDFAAAAQAEFRAFTDVEHEMHNDTTRPAVYALISDFIDRLAGRA
ncbi:MAG: alpha/beta hydrolase [Litorimonas sp.]